MRLNFNYRSTGDMRLYIHHEVPCSDEPGQHVYGGAKLAVEQGAEVIIASPSNELRETV